MQFRNKSEGSKNFLKLENGDSIRGVFRGDIYEFRQHWENGKSVFCLGDTCPICEQGKKPNFRFRLNLVVKENEAYVVKVYESGWTMYEALKALHEGDYNLENHLMKITRHGTGLDTTYSVVPVPNGTLTNSQQDTISQLELIPLAHETKKTEEVHDFSKDGDIPF